MNFVLNVSNKTTEYKSYEKTVNCTLFSGRVIVTCLYVSYKIVSKKIWFCRVCNKIFRKKILIILKLYIN